MSKAKFSAILGLAALLLGCSDGSSEPLGSTTNNAASSSSQGAGPTGTGGNAGTGGMGSGGMGTGGVGTGGDGGTVDPDYPGPPYGNMVGDTMALLTWEGHHNPAADQIAANTPYLDSFTTDDVRKSTGGPFALIHTAAVF